MTVPEGAGTATDGRAAQRREARVPTHPEEYR